MIKTFTVPYHYATQTEKEKKDAVAQVMCLWFGDIRPTHFVTIRMPAMADTNDVDKFTERLHWLLAQVERQLVGKRWNKSFIPFYGVYELGKSKFWHAHLVLNSNGISEEELQKAFDEAGRLYRKVKYHTDKTPDIQVKPIDGLDRATGYMCKELHIGPSDIRNSGRVFSAETLFNLSREKARISQVGL